MTEKKSLLFFASAILLFGLVMIFSTTSFEILDADSESIRFLPLIKQILYFIAGLAIGWMLMKVGTKRFWSAVPILFWTVSLLLLLTLIPGIGREVNGSRRWLSIAGISFQPSEFAKLIVPLYFAYFYLRMRDGEIVWEKFFSTPWQNLDPNCSSLS